MAKSRVKKVKTQKVQVGPSLAWEQLMLLRDTTRRLGGLHELQMTQMKIWPLIFIGAKTSVAEFGYETKQVVYRLEGLKKRPAKFQHRLEHLDKATKQLLGDEYLVTIMLDGKQIYNGPARKAE